MPYKDPEKRRIKAREYQRAYVARDPERARKQAMQRERLRSHGQLVDVAWAAMWEAQQGQCYLCGNPMLAEKTMIDHDHSCCPPKQSCSICRRGLAHIGCNLAIGYAADDPSVLRRMADALEAAKSEVRQRDGQAVVPFTLEGASA